MTVTLVVVAVAVVSALLALLVEAKRHTGEHAGDAVLSERWLVQRLSHRPRLAHLLHRRLDPSAAGGLVITVAFAVVGATALVTGVLVDWVHSSEGLAELDGSFARWGAEHGTAATTDVLTAITQLGSTTVVSVTLAVAVVIDFARARNWHTVWFALLVSGGQLVLVVILKAVIGRDRPDILQLVDVNSPSFPSGHSAAAAACWAAVAFILSRDRKRRTRTCLGAVAVLIAIAVAASRVLLGVHWMTDVVAGLAIGWGWTLTLIVLYSRQFRPIADLVDRAAASAEQAAAG